MIGAILSIICGFVNGLKTPLVSPLVLALSFRKSLYVFGFFVYCLLLCFECNGLQLALAVATIILLDDGLKRNFRDKFEYFLLSLSILTWLSKDTLLIVAILILIYRIMRDNARKGWIAYGLGFLLLMFGFFLFKYVDVNSSRVVVLSSLGVFLFAIFWKRSLKKLSI